MVREAASSGIFRTVAHLDPKDGGYASRKFWFAVGTSMLIFVGSILSGLFKMMGPHYDTMISGLIGVLGLYLTGNLGSRWVTSKAIAGTVAPAPTDQAPDASAR